MRILSGIQPSGALHLGNFFGMMKPAIELQEQGQALYFIANYHSMTSLFDAAQRRRNTMDVALDFLACGLDPQKAVSYTHLPMGVMEAQPENFHVLPLGQVAEKLATL